MSLKARQVGQSKTIALNMALTLTGTPTTNGAGAPLGNVVAFLQNSKLTDWVTTGEVWRPLGIQVQATTTITVTPPVAQLQRAPASTTSNTFASPSSGGVATMTLLVAGSARYYPFTTYVTAAGASNFIADAAGDVWAVNISTSPTAGAANIQLHYCNINVAGISDAITTL